MTTYTETEYGDIESWVEPAVLVPHEGRPFLAFVEISRYVSDGSGVEIFDGHRTYRQRSEIADLAAYWPAWSWRRLGWNCPDLSDSTG